METNQLKNEIEQLIVEIRAQFDLIKPDTDNQNAAVLMEKIEQLYKKSLIFDFLIKETKPKTAIPIGLSEHTNEFVSTPSAQNNPSEKNILVDTNQVVLDLFSEKEESKQPDMSPIEIALPKNTPSKKLVDIRTIIGINEKFRFINELFAGSLQEYNIVINQVNTISNVSDAQAYLDSLRVVYHWKNENSTVENFFELIVKRFQ